MRQIGSHYIQKKNKKRGRSEEERSIHHCSKDTKEDISILKEKR